MLPPTELVILIFIYMVEVYKIDLSLSFYLFQVQKTLVFQANRQISGKGISKSCH